MENVNLKAVWKIPIKAADQPHRKVIPSVVSVLPFTIHSQTDEDDIYPSLWVLIILYHVQRDSIHPNKDVPHVLHECQVLFYKSHTSGALNYQKWIFLDSFLISWKSIWILYWKIFNFTFNQFGKFASQFKRGDWDVTLYPDLDSYSPKYQLLQKTIHKNRESKKRWGFAIIGGGMRLYKI